MDLSGCVMMSSDITSKGEFRMLPDVLQVGETPKCIITGMYNNRSGMLVATDRRLVFLDKQMFGVMETETILYEALSAVQWSTGVLMGSVTLHAHGKSNKVTNVQKAYVRYFANYIETRIMGGDAEAVLAAALDSGATTGAQGGGGVAGARDSGATTAAQSGGDVAATQDGGDAGVAQSGGDAAATQGGGEVAAAQGGGEVAAAQGGGEVAAAQGGGEVAAAQGGGEVAAAPKKSRRGKRAVLWAAAILLAIVGCGSCVVWASSLDGGSEPPMKSSDLSAYIYGGNGELALLK